MFKLWNNLFSTHSTIFVLAFLLVLPFTAFTVSVLNSSKVNASGPIPLTSSISTISPDGTKNFNVSDTTGNSWQDKISTANLSTQCSSSGIMADLQYNVDNNTTYRIVTQRVWSAGIGNTNVSARGWQAGATGVLIGFNNFYDEIYHVNDYGADGNTLAPWDVNPGNYWAFLTIDDSGDYWFDCGAVNGGSFSRVNASVLAFAGQQTDLGNQGYIYYSSFSFEYPPDYEGGISTPTFPVDPAVELDWIPDLNIVTASGYQLIVQDQNFNTFDDVPFTCAEGLTPIIFYEIWQGDDPTSDVLINSGSFSATIGFHTSLPAVASHYVYVGWYSCGTAPTDPVFTYQAFMPFEMNAYGSLVSGCDAESFQGLICSMGGNVNIGIFSSTFNGFVGILRLFSQIDSTYCNTNWVSTMHFEDNYIGVQNIPGEICSNVQAFYLTPGSSFYPIKVWVNVIMSGTAVLLLVFGLLALFGLRGRLTSPIGEGDGNAIRPDIATDRHITGHRAPYVKGKSGTPLGISGDGGLSYRRSRRGGR